MLFRGPHCNSVWHFSLIENAAKSGVILVNRFTSPKTDRNSLRFVGLSFSIIPCTFVLIGEMPELVNLKPNHSTARFAELHIALSRF